MLRPDTAHIYEGGDGAAEGGADGPGAGTARGVSVDSRHLASRAGGDGVYYMTGTSGNLDAIHLWRSHGPEALHVRQAACSQLDEDPTRALVQPRAGTAAVGAGDPLHLKGTYWIAWCVNLKLGMGLLKSSQRESRRDPTCRRMKGTGRS